MVWRLLLSLSLFALGVHSLTKNCDTSCNGCAYKNDSASCTGCSISGNILFTVNDQYGYCAAAGQCTSSLGYLSADQKKCYIGGNCPPGYFISNSTCSVCDSGCKECSGSGNNQCLSCPTGKILSLNNSDVGTCILPSACPSGQLSADKNLCAGAVSTSCTGGCASCYGNSSLCLNCSGTNVLALENYASSTAAWGTCTAAMIVKRKYYTFGFDPNNITIQYKCHWTCQSCVAENDPNACITCSSNAYLNILSDARGYYIGNCKAGCAGPTDFKLDSGTRKYCNPQCI